MKILGIDPGARYTGVVIREDDEVTYASTFVRPLDIPPVTWAVRVVEMIRTEVLDKYPKILVGIEGIADPKGYQQGKKSPINPRDIIRAGIVLGAITENIARTHRVVIIPPKKNGSQPTDWYPTALRNKRPDSLPGTSQGAGTRNHEKSAYDVAGEVLFQLNDGYVLDMRPEL